MIVVMTSWAPVRALRNPTIPAYRAPNTIAAMRETMRWTPAGRLSAKPTNPPPMAAKAIWPCTPMLNRPARKGTATASPARISGADTVRVSDSG